MKIAYLILAHDNPVQVKRLINALTHENSHIFLHIDKKSDSGHFPPQADNLSIIKDRISVSWGRFSMVQATLNLIKEAVAWGGFDYYILLSGSSYPIRSNEEIFNFFHEHKGYEFINSHAMSETTKPLGRVEYFYSQEGIVQYIFPLVKKIMKILKIKRRLPRDYLSYKPYAGSQWWALSDSCMTYIVEFVRKNPQFVSFFRTTWIPDEMFFQMIISNSSFTKKVKTNLMYVDWFFSWHTPQIINNNHFRIINEIIQTKRGVEQFLFARKFDDKSTNIVDLIDTHFRGSDNILETVDDVDKGDNQKIGASNSKYLVFTSAGDRSSLHHWLKGNRNFDLWVTYYGEQGFRYRDISDFYNIRKGCKFPNLHYVYQHWKHILDRYEAIFVMDDDVIISGSDISCMFELRKQHDFWICQPAFGPRSKISHDITRVKNFNFARYTNFVEVTCPLFRRDKLDAFMKVYEPVLLGYGVDWWFIDLFRADLKNKIAVVDAITCINPLDSIKGGTGEIDRYLNKNARIELWQKIKKKYNLKIDEDYYVEFGFIKDLSKSGLIDHLRFKFIIIYYNLSEPIYKFVFQIRRSRFHLNLFRFPFHLKIEIALLKIKVLLGLSINPREKYLDQLLGFLIGTKGICVKENAISCIVRIEHGIELDVANMEESFTSVCKNLKLIKEGWIRHQPAIDLIVKRLKSYKSCNLKIVYIGQNGSYGSFCLKNKFPNSKIIILEPGQAYSLKSDGIIKLMEDHGSDDIDLLDIDIEGVEYYLLEDENGTSEFLSKTKFVSIKIQENVNVRDRIYHMLRSNGFVFSTKDGLTLGFNKNFQKHLLN